MSSNKINKDNYEAWLLDYAEGNLTTEQEGTLFDFMKANPQFKDDYELAFDEDFLNTLLPVKNASLPVDDKIDLHIKPVNSISAANYEELIIAYLEGQLNGEVKENFKAFVNLNPVVQKELKYYLASKLEANNQETFSSKEVLLFSASSKINAENYEDFLVGKIEQTLSPEEEKEVEAFIASNPIILSELKYFEATKLAVDRAIVYPDKAGLKKAAPIFYLFQNSYLQTAIAASILLLIGFSLFNNQNITPAIVAEVKESPTKDSIVKVSSPDESTDESKPTENKAESTPNKEKKTQEVEMPVKTPSIEKRRSEETIEKLKLRWQLNKTIQPDYQIAFKELKEEYIQPIEYDLEEPLLAEVKSNTPKNDGFKTVPQVLTNELDKRLFNNNEKEVQSTNNDRFLAAANKLLKSALNSEIKVQTDTVRNTEMVAFTTPFFEIERKK